MHWELDILITTFPIHSGIYLLFFLPKKTPYTLSLNFFSQWLYELLNQHNKLPFIQTKHDKGAITGKQGYRYRLYTGVLEDKKRKREYDDSDQK
jgi:hypothetical protein